jgi:glycosyltransferase involved in cell wall biosynthesis
MTSSFYPAPGVLGGGLVQWLPEELARIGHEVHVLYSQDAHSIKKFGMPEKTERAGVTKHAIKTSFDRTAYEAYILGDSHAANEKFLGLVRRYRPEVVNHHNISLLGYGILRKRGDYLNLWTAHDYWLICQQSNLFKNGLEVCDNPSCFTCALRCRRPPQFWRLGRQFTEAVRDIDVLIAPSDCLKEKILQSLDIRAITLPYFVPPRPNTAQSPGLSNFFLYAGPFERHKGILDLVQVYVEARQEIGKELVVTGRGSLENKIRDLVKRSGVEDKIKVLGWVDQDVLDGLQRDAQAVIVPSVWPENNPASALEALSVGTPVIASNKGDLPEIVGRIDRKLVYGSRDELKRILISFDKTRYPSYIVRSVYEKHYSPRVYLEKYLGLIRNMASAA